VIPTFNDTPEEIGAIADFASSLEGVSEMHILPYHKMGTDKYTGLGREYLLPDLEPPSKEHMQKLLEVVLSKGLYGQIGG
jgi:pyruvate formate lyase activating enzyme